MDDIDNKKKVKGTQPDASRRKFITKTVTGAGATAAATLLTAKVSAAADSVNGNAIKIPEAFAQAASTAPVKPEFPMNGAQVFARICKEEGLAALFSCPGNYGIVNAIAQE